MKMLRNNILFSIMDLSSQSMLSERCRGIRSYCTQLSAGSIEYHNQSSPDPKVVLLSRLYSSLIVVLAEFNEP